MPRPTSVRSAARTLFFLLMAPLASRAGEPPTLDVPPRLERFVEAEPPPELEERKQVDVVLTIDIDERGGVQSVTVAQSGGPAFDDAAVAAAKHFVFTPGQSHDKPVPVRITYRYRFFYKPVPEPKPEPEPVAQIPTVPLEGQLRARGDRTPLAGVSILIDEDAAHAVTDENGHFSLSLPPGPHRVRLRAPIILPADLKLTLSPNKKLTVTWYVNARARYTSTVRTKVVEEAVEQSLSGEELRHIPGTQGDTLKAVQTLPGVARAPFGGGQIVVWGSQPGDTRTYVDGVFIPTLFHFFGLRSVVPSDFVQALDFYPGGYGAEHGRGLGGVIEIESARPRADGIHGFLQIDVIDAQLLLSAKVSKNVEIAVAARRSLLDTWLPHVTPNQVQLTPAYYDYQAKLHWRASLSDDVDVFVLGSDDAVHAVAKRPDPNQTGQFDSHIFFHRVLAKWTHRLGKITFTVTPSFGYDIPFEFSGNLGNTNLTVDAHDVSYSLRAVARVPLYDFLRLDAGLDFEGNRYDISARAPVNGMPREGDPPGFRGQGGFVQDSSTSYSHNVAPYLALFFRLWHDRLHIDPQLRLDVYSLEGYQGTPNAYNRAYVQAEPRLAVKLRIVKWAALKAALGVYHQPPDQTALSATFGSTGVSPELAIHYVLGVDLDPTPTLHIELEGFYKDLRSLLTRGETITEPRLLNDGIGRVYGGELLVRQELWKNFYGWVTYTLSRAERKDHPDQPWRLFQYDQTHILSLVASYKLPRGWQVGLRFRYVTGNPNTPVVGAYFDATAGRYRALLGEPFSQRSGDFHQLDLRVDKTWTFNKWKLSAYLDIQNVYNHQSPEGVAYNFDYSQSTPVSGLPIVPALGVRGEL